MEPPLKPDLLRFLDSPDDPVEGALVVAAIVDESADADWVRSEIDRLAEAMESKGRVTPKRVVQQFAACGFEGAHDNYYEVENSVLDHVLRNRRGIPISLGVVLIGVARRLGLDALGVNFPRHFLITIGDLLVDPYAVAPTSVEHCRRWLKENKVAEAGAFNIADARDIAMRMLNNVRMLVHERGDYAWSLELSDYQLMITPDSYGLYVERADAWLGLRAPEMVVHELEQAVRHAPDEAMAARLQERIVRARRLKSVVN